MGGWMSTVPRRAHQCTGGHEEGGWVDENEEKGDEESRGGGRKGWKGKGREQSAQKSLNPCASLSRGPDASSPIRKPHARQEAYGVAQG